MLCTPTPILPIPPHILNREEYPTAKQVGPELANEIQRLLTEMAIQNNLFAIYSTFPTPTPTPSPKLSQITNWGQVEENEEQVSSYLLNEDYLREPWICYNPHHHSNHIYVPASNTDNEIHIRAI